MNFSRLGSSQLSNHGHATYCCRQCLHAYSTQELLDAHAFDCYHVQRTKFPDNPKCRLTNIQKQLSVPFVVYADCESILKHDDNVMDTTQGVATGSGESSSRAFQEHVPCSFAYKIVSSSLNDFSKSLVSYREKRKLSSCLSSTSLLRDHCYCLLLQSCARFTLLSTVIMQSTAWK